MNSLFKSRHRFRPALSKTLMDRRRGYKIYAVNAFAVRNSAEADVSFTSFATHQELPDLIPDDEIWIWANLAEREGEFFIANALASLKAREEGASQERATQIGLDLERRLREQLTGVKYRAGKPHRRIPPQIRVKRYLTLSDPVFPLEIWLVDGFWVRCLYKTDYNDGGHGYVYPWCPKREIWMEKDLDRAELPLLIAHEYVELRLMREEELKYEQAHSIASEVEYDLRKPKPRSEFPGLSRRRLKKTDVNKFTDDEFIDYVKRNYQHGLLRRIKTLVADAASSVLP